MRPYCIFINCLVLFTFCSLTQSEFSQGPAKCCFSYTNVQIPVKQIVSYHITRPECHKCGIIIITKNQREICADPTERWAKRLMNLQALQKRRCRGFFFILFYFFFTSKALLGLYCFSGGRK
uniref:Chemokine interleukin-8-like domain-containing protein n=1 Tax=Cyprinus carpio TaxID=7962 RepID=A0A8C2B0L0_CYPCA